MLVNIEKLDREIEVGDMVIFSNGVIRLIIKSNGLYYTLNMEHGITIMKGFKTIEELLGFYLPNIVKEVIKSENLEIRRK